MDTSRQALVIGAGLAGAAVAAALCQRGWRITLLDAAPGPAQAASALPVGVLSPHLTRQPTPMSRLTALGVPITRAELERLVRAMGGVIEEDCSVTGFDREGTCITGVHTNQGRFEGREVLMALGAWSPLLGKQLGLDIPIQPGKGYSITYSQPRIWPRIPIWPRPGRILSSTTFFGAVARRGRSGPRSADRTSGPRRRTGVGGGWRR